MSVSAMMLPVDIHELLGAGIRAARLRRGWRQQDASRWFRFYGLATWTPTAVGQVEAGTRKPSIGDLLLACVALEVTVADLVPDVDDLVDLGTGATMSTSAVRALLAGSWQEFPRNPAEFAYPGEAWAEAELERAGAERDRLRRLLQPIVDGSSRAIPDDEMHRVFLTATEAEDHAAKRLHVEAAQLKLAARVLWGRDFEDERDVRVGDVSGVSARTLAARRGHAARSMLAELREFLSVAYSARGTG